MFKLFLLLFVISSVGGAYAYHQVTVSQFEAGIAKLEANNKTLKDNNTELQRVGEANATALAESEAQKAEERQQIATLTAANQELQQQKKRYLSIFKDHNLTRLARAKPGLIEKRVNAGTASIFRQVEEDSKEVQNAAN